MIGDDCWLQHWYKDERGEGFKKATRYAMKHSIGDTLPVRFLYLISSFSCCFRTVNVKCFRTLRCIHLKKQIREVHLLV